MKKIENEKALLKSALDYEQIQMFNEKKRIYKKAEKPKKKQYKPRQWNTDC